MSERPIMNFEVGDLFNEQDFERGPVLFYWGQDEEQQPRRDLDLGDWPEPRKVKWWRRRKGVSCWRMMLRLQPPPEEDLSDWGRRMAAALGIPFTAEGQPGDTAIWLPASTTARDASQAMASAGLLLGKLDGFKLVALQAKVWRADQDLDH